MLNISETKMTKDIQNLVADLEKVRSSQGDLAAKLGKQHRQILEALSKISKGAEVKKESGEAVTGFQ